MVFLHESRIKWLNFNIPCKRFVQRICESNILRQFISYYLKILTSLTKMEEQNCSVTFLFILFYYYLLFIFNILICGTTSWLIGPYY